MSCHIEEAIVKERGWLVTQGSGAPSVCWIDVPGFWSLLWACCWGSWRGVEVLPAVAWCAAPPEGGCLLAMLSTVSPSIVYFFYS